MHRLLKVSTGVDGLDDVLMGGYALGRSTLIAGGPGSGKTNLALNFVINACTRGEPVAFVAFEESPKALRRNAMTIGFDISQAEESKTLVLIDASLPGLAEIAGAFSLSGLLATITNQIKKYGIRHLVLDGLDSLTRLNNDEAHERRELQNLNRWLVDSDITTLITSKSHEGALVPSEYDDFLNYIVDCVIFLDHSVLQNTVTRRVRILKYRGSSFNGNAHAFHIGLGGTRLMPVSSIELMRPGVMDRFSTGVAHLDEVLGGGLMGSSTVLISGPTGSGKTTLAATIIAAANARDERVFFVSYEMSAEAMVQTMASAGIDLQTPVNTGMTEIFAVLPEATGAEEHLFQVIDRLEEFRPNLLVVDAISACTRMGSEEIAFNFVARLIGMAKRYGMSAIFTNQTTTLMPVHEISGVGVSSLIDTVILVDLIVQHGELNRSILVMKSRGTAHSNQQHEFFITSHGIVLADAYSGENGLVLGSARRTHELRLQNELRNKSLSIASHRASLERKRNALKYSIAASEAEMESMKTELEIAQLDVEDLERRLLSIRR
jgi:RecA-superfamily ATPases implicated in signal transduction